MSVNKAVDLLKMLRKKQEKSLDGLYVVTVKTVSPITLVFEGTSLALDSSIFVIPKSIRLEAGKRYFALPIVSDSVSPRWGIIQEIDSEGATGSFTTYYGDTVTVKKGTVTSIT